MKKIKERLCANFTLFEFFAYDKKLEEEFETAIKAIPESKRQELEEEKMRKSRLWLILMIIVSLLLQIQNRNLGLISENVFRVFTVFSVILSLMAIGSFYKLKLILPALFIFHLRAIIGYLTAPGYRTPNVPVEVITMNIMLIFTIVMNYQIISNLYRKHIKLINML